MPPKPMRSRISAPAPYTPVRKTEITTIGQNSPATPVPSTARPSGVGSRPESETIGTRVPRAVVASATPSSHHSASTPAPSSATPTASARAIEIVQPPVPRTSVARGTFLSITSSPAKKKRKTRPMVERNSM